MQILITPLRADAFIVIRDSLDNAIRLCPNAALVLTTGEKATTGVASMVEFALSSSPNAVDVAALAFSVTEGPFSHLESLQSLGKLRAMNRKHLEGVRDELAKDVKLIFLRDSTLQVPPPQALDIVNMAVDRFNRLNGILGDLCLEKTFFTDITLVNATYHTPGRVSPEQLGKTLTAVKFVETVMQKAEEFETIVGLLGLSEADKHGAWDTVHKAIKAFEALKEQNTVSMTDAAVKSKSLKSVTDLMAKIPLPDDVSMVDQFITKMKRGAAEQILKLQTAIQAQMYYRAVKFCRGSVSRR